MAKYTSLIRLTGSVLALAAVAACAGGTGTAGSSPGYASRNAATDANPTVPGATGDYIVRGDRSTIAGDRGATREEKQGVP